MRGVILEIGAADGHDTKELMELGKVYAFEPEPKNIKLLKQIPKIRLFEGVVSDIDGQMTFHRSNTSDPEALSLSGSVMVPKNHLKIWKWIHFDKIMPVQSVRLDTFCKDMKKIDFIWCDAQGAEALIIKGGKKTFKKTRYFYTEYSDDEQYENQPTLHKILELLPDWEILLDYGGDVLLKNKLL